MIANGLPIIAALGKSLKDGFGAMALYSLVSIGKLKLTAALLNPWIAVVIGILAIALFFVSLGMEGKALRTRILGFANKMVGVNPVNYDKPLTPINGRLKRFGMHCAIRLTILLRKFAPDIAGICKGVSGMGSTAGCLLLIFSWTGIIASTAITGTWPLLIIGFSAVVGVTLYLVSRFKEGDDFKAEADKFMDKCMKRLSLPRNGKAQRNKDLQATRHFNDDFGHFSYPPTLPNAGSDYRQRQQQRYTDQTNASLRHSSRGWNNANTVTIPSVEESQPKLSKQNRRRRVRFQLPDQSQDQLQQQIAQQTRVLQPLLVDRNDQRDEERPVSPENPPPLDLPERNRQILNHGNWNNSSASLFSSAASSNCAANNSINAPVPVQAVNMQAANMVSNHLLANNVLLKTTARRQ